MNGRLPEDKPAMLAAIAELLACGRLQAAGLWRVIRTVKFVIAGMKKRMVKVLVVAIGGGFGAVSRYLLSLWAADRFGTGFPYGTLIANVAGCFVIGAFMTLATERFIVNPHWRLLVTVGFIGGLTTFSSFSYETFKLLEDAQASLAAYNILLNLGLGFFATWLGITAARMV